MTNPIVAEVEEIRRNLDSSFGGWRKFDFRIERSLDRIVALAQEPVDPAPQGEGPTGGVRAAETVLEGAEGGLATGGVVTHTGPTLAAESATPECALPGGHFRLVESNAPEGAVFDPVTGSVTWTQNSGPPARTRVIHDPGALIEEPDEQPPARRLITGNGIKRQPGRETVALSCDECGELTCEHRCPVHSRDLPCRTCAPEPATGGTVAPHDQPTTEDGVGWRLARDEEIHRARPRMTDGCGPEHTYRGTCELAHWATEDGAL